VIVAGRTYRLTMLDGRVIEAAIKLGDEIIVERESQTRLEVLLRDSPAWTLMRLCHTRLRRDGVEVPAEVEDFADLVDDLEVVPGKAKDSDPAPPTG